MGRHATRHDDDDHHDFARLAVELFGDITPVLDYRYLIRGWLPRDGTIVEFGHPGCGKSFVALDMGLHIAAGREWMGRPVEQGGVIYLAAEGQAGLRMRIKAWRDEHQPSAHIPFALVAQPLDLLDPRADLARLGAALEECAINWEGIALLIIDTLAATFGGGDENGADMATYVGNIARLCQPHNCASLIVHHQPLNSEAKRPRGHGSLWGAADTVLHVTGDAGAPARRISVMKQKDASPSRDILFRLRQVEIGYAHDGEAVTSCIVEPVESDAILERPGKRKMPEKAKIAFQALDRLIIESGQFPPEEIPPRDLDRARTLKVASVSEWRSAAIAAMQSPDIAPDTARKSFDRARTTLQSAEFIGIWEDWVWLKP